MHEHITFSVAVPSVRGTECVCLRCRGFPVTAFLIPLVLGLGWVGFPGHVMWDLLLVEQGALLFLFHRRLVLLCLPGVIIYLVTLVFSPHMCHIDACLALQHGAVRSD